MLNQVVSGGPMRGGGNGGQANYKGVDTNSTLQVVQ